MRRQRILRLLGLPLAVVLVLWLYLQQTTCSVLAMPHAPQSAHTTAPSTADVTWPDVAPILYANCATCHHPHGNGPFSLLTYADARRWGTQVAQVTGSRYMPPWLPAHGYGDFEDERMLSAAEIATLAAWVKAGMPEGNASRATRPPVFNDTWTGGKPDLILTVERPYALPASGTDRFHNFILPFSLHGTHYIRAMEIRPSAPEVVHHANVLIDRTASLRREHKGDWQAGVEGMELNIDGGNSFDPDGHFLFWKADTPLLTEPPDMPWQLESGNDLVLNMHLKPSGKATLVSAQIGLYFTDKPPTRQPLLLQLEHDSALDIPAGQAHFTVEDHLTLPEAAAVLGIYPHAHYLGKDMQSWATLPDGTKRWLIWVRDWDIDRQAVYRFRSPIDLPRGSSIHMRYTYDNTADNPRNPHLPPVRVRAGNRAEDEMGHLWLQVLPIGTAGGKVDPRLPFEEAWMRRRLEKSPDDAVARYNLATALEAEGKEEEAVATFNTQLARQPDNARFLTGLGGALEHQGDWQGARAAWQRATLAAPDNCDAAFNLARVAVRHGEFSQAEAGFRAMMSHCPPDAAEHSGLAAALDGEGKAAEAQRQYRAALLADPDDFTANYALGAQHLQAGQTELALAELGRAVVANGEDLDAREHLAMALAQSNRPKDAVAQLRAAVAIAPENADLHALLSQVLASDGSLAEAIIQEKASLTLQPADADQWNNLGVLQARAGDRIAAAASFGHALRLRPADPQAQANLRHLERGVETTGQR